MEINKQNDGIENTDLSGLKELENNIDTIKSNNLFKKRIIIGIIILILFVVGGIYYYTSFIKNKNTQQSNNIIVNNPNTNSGNNMSSLSGNEEFGDLGELADLGDLEIATGSTILNLSGLKTKEDIIIKIFDIYKYNYPYNSKHSEGFVKVRIDNNFRNLLATTIGSTEYNVLDARFSELGEGIFYGILSINNITDKSNITIGSLFIKGNKINFLKTNLGVIETVKHNGNTLLLKTNFGRFSLNKNDLEINTLPKHLGSNIANKELTQKYFGNNDKKCFGKACFNLKKTIYYDLTGNNDYIFKQYSGYLLENPITKFELNSNGDYLESKINIMKGIFYENYARYDTILSYNSNTNESFIDIDNPGSLSSGKYYIRKINENLFLTIGTGESCGTERIQSFHNSKGEAISGNNKLNLGIPVNVKIGKLDYELKTYDFKQFNFNGDGIISTSTNNVNNILNQMKWISKDITIIFEDKLIGGIYGLKKGQNIKGNSSLKTIEGKNANPFLIITGYSNQGEIKDLKLTKEIYNKYYSGQNLSIIPINKFKNDYYEDKDLINIDKINSKSLPIFIITQLDNQNRAILSLSPKYESISIGGICKPAIYSYDKDNQLNKVKIGFNGFPGKFTHIEPEFNLNNGWEYKSINNKIQVGTGLIDYLYYAVDIGKYEYNTQGYIVKGSNILDFLNDKLNKLNFRENEKNDFIEFWKDKFEPNNFYMISFKFNEQIDKYISLDFDKKPNSINRIIMEAVKIGQFNINLLYNPLENNKYDNFFLKKIERNGDFDIFEWGGSLIDGNKSRIY